jgi:prepilin-type processing-associated H-X9-DG protein/prepilin-type N-terminal cleavage/methylation domain-containing protein
MRPANRHSYAFTLIELLVVIGIIALLLAILMPSLSMARQAANRVSCASKLHEILVAGQLSANDHKGFYPPAGVLPGWKPADLDDPYSSKYSYMTDSDDTIGFFSPYVAPITISLAAEMSYRAIFVDNNAGLAVAETDSNGFIRQFLCPAQASSTSELPQSPMLYSAATIASYQGNEYLLQDVYWEQQSYNFNEAVLGFGDVNTNHRLCGQLSLIRQPAKTLFAADGLMGSVYDDRYPYAQGNGMATFYNIANNAPVTLADALTGDGLAGDIQNFDLQRHRGKINIGFCDGHVETRNITPQDLDSVFLLAP